MKREPEIVIRTNGIWGTEVFVNGKKLSGVLGIQFRQSFKENKGLPILQIDMKATNVALETKMLPALPEPFAGHYLPINALVSAEGIPNEAIDKVCREFGYGLEIS